VVVDAERSIWNGGVCVGQGAVGVDVVSSPWWVDENGMGSGQRPGRGDENELGQAKHGSGRMVRAKAVGRQRCFSLQVATQWLAGSRHKQAGCGGGGHGGLRDTGLGRDRLVRRPMAAEKSSVSE
jgi:hypothetical protein